MGGRGKEALGNVSEQGGDDTLQHYQTHGFLDQQLFLVTLAHTHTRLGHWDARGARGARRGLYCAGAEPWEKAASAACTWFFSSAAAAFLVFLFSQAEASLALRLATLAS